MASKLPDVKAFGGCQPTLTKHTSELIQADLEAARIPYADDRGAVFDFHALRVQCASLLIASGADPKLAQEIMRHSSIGLTMDVYAKLLGDGKKSKAVAGLPDLSLPESQTLAKTGTDDTGEIYREVYSQDTSDRTASANIIQANAGSEPKTALTVQKQGSRQMNSPNRLV